MAITYEPISTTTLGSAQTSVTFSSISGTYTDLVLVCFAQSTSTSPTDTRYRLRFNSDTGTNYSTTYLYGNGSGAGSARDTTRAQIDNATQLSYASEFTPILFNIMNYANTTTYKTVLQRAGQQNNVSGYSGALVGTAVSLWRSTSAITSVEISAFVNGQFNTNSTFTLFGIKAA